MSERQEKRKRLNAKERWIRDFERWLKREPCILLVFSWYKWKKQKPNYENYLKEEII